MDETIKFLKEITELNGISGQEENVRKYIKDKFSIYADEVFQDGIGSLIAVKKAKEENPKILIAGHMDEVGFMVENITKEGFIKFIPIGGWWNQVMLAQQVTITTSDGKQIHGVVGSKPPHILTPEERKVPVEIEKMFIDIGVASSEEARNLGISEGDMISPYIEFREMGNSDYLLSKAWDNRIGCAVAFELLKQLSKEKLNCNYYAVASVQEEVGLRGAQTSSFMVNPDIVVAIDVGIANDVPGGDGLGMSLGKGPQLMIYDGGLVGHRKLREFIISLAKDNNIPYQISSLKRGATDAGKMHLVHNGSPAISLCIPSRYIHSHTSMIHKQDYLNAVKLLRLFVENIDATIVQKIKYE